MRIAVVFLSMLLLQGCYVMQTARGHLELMSGREPVADLIAAPDTPDALRERLALAVELRDFALDELLLPAGDNYTTFVDVGRPFVLWNVVAAPEFSVRPLRWCFPVAGCVPYRGYFDEAAARGFAERHARRGHDVRVGGVSVYSTLGWFSDPLLSTMLDKDEIELAALIFHELAHRRLYVRGDAAFNEAFATVVAEEGVRRWLAASGRPELIDEYRARRTRRIEFAELVGETRDELAALYATGMEPDEMRRGKAAAFERLRERYREVRDARWDGFPGYDRWFERELNNADLVAVATYHELVPGLRALLAQTGHDLAAFYERSDPRKVDSRRR